MSNEKPVELTEAEMDAIIKAFFPFDHSCAHNCGPVFNVVERIVAAREAAARREALLEREDWISPLVHSERAAKWLARVEAVEEERDGWKDLHARSEEALEHVRKASNAARAKVARVEALVEDFRKAGFTGVYESAIEIAELIDRALAEPERDEEGGRDDTPLATPEQIEASRAFLAAQAEWDELRKQVRG